MLISRTECGFPKNPEWSSTLSPLTLFHLKLIFGHGQMIPSSRLILSFTFYRNKQLFYTYLTFLKIIHFNYFPSEFYSNEVTSDT